MTTTVPTIAPKGAEQPLLDQVRAFIAEHPDLALQVRDMVTTYVRDAEYPALEVEQITDDGETYDGMRCPWCHVDVANADELVALDENDRVTTFTAEDFDWDRHSISTGTISTLLFSESHSPADGISRDADTVTVLHSGGRYQAEDGTPAVRMVTRPNILPGLTLHHFEPVEACPADRVGYMASGAWVVVGVDLARALGIDPAAYPLHDRSETPTQYADLAQ